MVAIFEQVLDFARDHLSREEILMAQLDYPDLPQHRRAHAQLLARITELLLKLRASDASAPADAELFLKNWLTSHVEGADKNFYRFLKERHD